MNVHKEENYLDEPNMFSQEKQFVILVNKIKITPISDLE